MDIIHWAYEAANKIIQKNPDKEVLTCASGVSPSGYVHVGNFREIATTYFVTKALADLGKKPRFILSWDDYDRLRKIPANVHNISETEIGKPYTKVKCPAVGDTQESYGEYFETLFEKDLKKLNIHPEYLYQTKHYESGDYDQALLKVIKQRKTIYDILSQFRTEAPSANERENYYPFSLYCDVCQHDSTTITQYDEASQSIFYTCHCGHSGKQKIGQQQHIKLHWKIDWPMRWAYEQVLFEPGGKDHSSKNGSFDVAKAVAKEIFSYDAPTYEPYDFVMIKGQTKKMSSSAGNVLTLSDLLAIYTPELVFYLYAKYLPKSSFNLGLDDDVLRNYSEFEKKVQAIKEQAEADETAKQMIHLTGVDLSENYPSFSHVVNILSLTNNDQQLTQELLEKEQQYSANAIAHILPRAAFWIENDAKNRLLRIQEKKDDDFFEALPEATKQEISQFVVLLQKDLTDMELMQQVYDLTPTHDKKAKRQGQKQLFQAIYRLVLGQESGPRIPVLVKVVGKEKLIKLLS